MAWIMVLEITGVIGGVATILALLLAPMFWLGSKIDSFRESVRKDMDDLRKEMDDFRESVRKDMDDFRKDMDDLRKDFNAETKDFHGRLCAIEERNKGK